MHMELIYGVHIYGRKKDNCLPNNGKCNIIAPSENHIDNGWAKHLDVSLLFL
jgi:hypothetical protein